MSLSGCGIIVLTYLSVTRLIAATVVSFKPDDGIIKLQEVGEGMSIRESSIEFPVILTESRMLLLSLSYNASFELRAQLVPLGGTADRLVCDLSEFPEGESIEMRLLGSSGGLFVGRLSITQFSPGDIEHTPRSQQTRERDYQSLVFSSLCAILPVSVVWRLLGFKSRQQCWNDAVCNLFFFLCLGFVCIICAFFYKLNLVLTVSGAIGLMIPIILTGSKLLKDIRRSEQLK
jgi:hypothetical protein